MVIKLGAGLLLFASMCLLGCGEHASKEDMIDAPVAPPTLTQDASSKARGLSDEQIARKKAEEHGGPGATVPGAALK